MQRPRVETLVQAGLFTVLLSLVSRTSEAQTLADSTRDWAPAQQGRDGWTYGYHNASEGSYSPDSFRLFEPSHWRGDHWRLVPSASPWTQIGGSNPAYCHPNGTNSAFSEEHWPIRRWTSESFAGFVIVEGELGAQNLGGNGTTLVVYHNGEFLDRVSTNSSEAKRIETPCLFVRPGDVIDFALTPWNGVGAPGEAEIEGDSGNREDFSDGSFVRGAIRVAPHCTPEHSFRRGDSNRDRFLDISDAVHTLLHLYGGGSGADLCLDASDANDDSRVDLTDAVFLLSYLLGNGTPPPAPGGHDCGEDPTPDGLGCAIYDDCPSDSAPLTEIAAVHFNAERQPSGTVPAFVLAPTEVLQAEFELELRNDGCLDCRHQLVVGIDGDALEVVYDGIPSPLEISRVLRTAAITFPEIGSYTLRGQWTRASNTAAAIMEYSESDSQPLALISTTGPAPGIHVTDVRFLDGVQADALDPGATTLIEVQTLGQGEATCPDCRHQLVVAVGNQVLDCYGLELPKPGPGGIATSTTYRFQAPVRAGTYSIYAQQHRAETCSEALGVFSFSEAEVVSSFTVRSGVSLESFDVTGEFTASDGLKLGPGQNGTVSVHPGQDLRALLNLRLSGDPDRPTDRYQFVLGLEDQGIACLYDGITDSPSPRFRSFSHAFRAPALPGLYRLYGVTRREADCQAALNAYEPAGAPLLTLDVRAGVRVVAIQDLTTGGSVASRSAVPGSLPLQVFWEGIGTDAASSYPLSVLVENRATGAFDVHEVSLELPTDRLARGWIDAELQLPDIPGDFNLRVVSDDIWWNDPPAAVFGVGASIEVRNLSINGPRTRSACHSGRGTQNRV